jgi:hypothetical protein
MTRCRVASMLCCEIAKTGSGFGPIGRRSVFYLEASTTRSRRLHTVYAERNCYNDALRPELFHALGNNGDPKYIDHIQPPLLDKGGQLGGALVRSTDRHVPMPLSKGRIAKKPVGHRGKSPDPHATGFAASHLAHGADRIIDIKHGEAHRPRKRPPPPSGGRRWGAAPKRVLSKGPVMPSRPGELHPVPLTEP